MRHLLRYVKILKNKYSARDSMHTPHSAKFRARRNIGYLRLSCIGCSLCEALCPSQAITVAEIDGIGFKPIINEDRCSNCGLCIDLCPLSRISYPDNLDKVKAVFYGFSRIPSLYYYGASGGVVSTVLYYLFDKKLIDAAYVAFYDDKLNTYGDIITSKDEIQKHAGSYYLHPKYMINIRKIAKYRSVAFVGLPCHVEALMNFARKFHINNIYIVISIFCSFGRMRAGLRDFLRSRFGLKLEDLRVARYMSRYGTKRAPGNVSIVFKEGFSVKFSFEDHIDYIDCFYTPIGCFNCRRMFGLNGDISVGDAWNLRTDYKIALVLANTVKGLTLLNEMMHNDILHLKPVRSDEALTYLHSEIKFKVYRSSKARPLYIFLKLIGLLGKKLYIPNNILNVFRPKRILNILRQQVH